MKKLSNSGKIKIQPDQILDSINTAIFWKDTECRFQGGNRAFLNFFDISSESDILGKTDEDLGWHMGTDLFKKEESRILTEKISIYRIHEKCSFHRKKRNIVISESPVLGSSGKVTGIVGCFEDVTEETRQREKKDRLNAKLIQDLENEEKVNKSLNEFMSRTSHEIRTPMNAVIGLSQLGLDQTKDPSAADYFNKICTSGKYLIEIIDDILDMRKIESGELELVKSRTSFHEVFDNIHILIDPLAQKKGVEFVLDKSRFPVYYAVCDQLRVQQVLVNLLTNAVKFTSSGGQVKLTASQKLTDNMIDAVFVVEDSGCGMSRAFQKRLFDPFTQENRDPSLYGTGTGIGLTISKRFAVLMDGDITAESTEGKGSTFTFTAKFDRCSGGDVEKSRSETRAMRTNLQMLSGKRVLLAEDNAINAEIAAGILKRVGIVTDVARNGKKAVEKFASSPEAFYNAVLMDIQMPFLNGYLATEQIRKLNRADAGTVPIIAMTADVFENSINQAYQSGMNAYIMKPIDVNAVYAALKKHILK